VKQLEWKTIVQDLKVRVHVCTGKGKEVRKREIKE